jgi:hypothetical protein
VTAAGEREGAARRRLWHIGKQVVGVGGLGAVSLVGGGRQAGRRISALRLEREQEAVRVD